MTIDGVDWLSQHGVRPLDISYVQHTPQNRYEGIGAIYGFPPHAALTDPRIKQAWDQRKPLEGSTLAPNNGRSSFTNVFIGFTGTSGSAGPLRVRYTDASGRQGVVRSHIRVVVRPLCD